jgi:hypothetical protein
MKRTLSVLLLLSLLLACSPAMAADMGVQVIGGNAVSESVSLDDVKLEATVEVPGWGDVTPLTFSVQDCVMIRKPGQLLRNWRYSSKGSHSPEDRNSSFKFNLEVTCKEHGDEKYPWYCEDWVTHILSQSQADFAILRMDILNTTPEKKDYLKECSVKVVFDDSIEYAGWCYQINEDLNAPQWIDNSDNFVIDPYYAGHYVFGCTLPNAVFTSKKPLRMEITIDGNEIIYNIRK